jgi:hypothetical protein
MVDLPQPSERVVTSEAPRSEISAAEVASPYQQFAQALDKTGEALNQVAIPLAEQAAARAVTRDADGNIQVERAPIVGPAGVAYSRAIKVGALAEADGDSKRKDIELREEFRDNPQGYVTAATAFKDARVKQMTDAAGPEVGVALGRTIDQTTTQTYRGLLNEKERLDLERANNSITAGIQSTKDDLAALARAGKTDSPEFLSLAGNLQSLYGEKVANPRLAFPKEQANFELDQFHGELGGQAYLFHIDQAYKDGGAAPALESAKSVLTDTTLKLSPEKREAFYHLAVGEVRANEAIRKQDVNEAHAAFNELSMASATGATVLPDQVEQVADAYRKAGDPGGAARVYSMFARKPLNDDFGRQPISEQASQLNALRGATAARTAFQFFTGKGYTPEQASGIVGNLVHESAVDPTLSGDNGTSGGIAQFHAERLAALRQFASERGKPATDFQTQLEFIDKELHSTEAGTLAKLQGAKTPEEAAAAFIDYERPQGWTPENPSGGLGFQSRQSLARQLFQGTNDMSGGPAQTAWLTANRQRSMNIEVRNQWTGLMKEYADNGIRPLNDAVNVIVTAARATGNADLLEKIGDDMARIDRAQQLSQEPLASQAATITQAKSLGTAGALAPGQDAVLKDLERRNIAITKGLQDNPVATAVENFPDKFKTPAPLNLGNPDELAAGLQARARISQVAAQNWQTGPLSALDKGEITQVKAALDTPDPAVKARIFGAIATLPNDVRSATLAKLGGNEPKEMARAAAGSLMTEAPDVATSIFRGEEAIKTDKRYDPEDADKKSYLSDIDRYLPSTVFSQANRTDPSGPYATAQLMVKQRYADLQAQAGQTVYSSDRLRQAVTDVTGGLLDLNGGKVIAPSRGMTQAQLDGIWWGVTDKDLSGVTSRAGQPITAPYLRGSGQLEGVGDGKYFVRFGSNSYAFKGSQPFVLDLRGRTPVQTPMDATPPPFNF